MYLHVTGCLSDENNFITNHMHLPDRHTVDISITLMSPFTSKELAVVCRLVRNEFLTANQLDVSDGHWTDCVLYYIPLQGCVL